MKEQCESEQFIAINDNMTMVATVFISNGKRARQRRDRKRVGVRGRALWGEKEGIDDKIDHSRKLVVRM